MITIHQRHRQTDGRTDRRTDRQTTCDRNTALCTKVHRAVKTGHHKPRYIENGFITAFDAVVAILMMITESRTFALDVGQSLRLDCEFYMDNFDLFDNPVIWKKRQHASTSGISSQINTMRNIHRPFVGTGRFDVTLTSAAPRYRIQLGIDSE